MTQEKKSGISASHNGQRFRASVPQTRLRPYHDTVRPIALRLGRGAPLRSPWLFTLLGVVALVAALWSYMLFSASTHQTVDQRVQHIASQLKCPICQGESVADAPVELAQEMRGIIRQKVQAGESDQQIIQFFIDRYGEQIVWSPPWWGFSLLTWLVPIGLLLGGVCLLFFTLRDWRNSASATSIPGVTNKNTATSEEDVVFAGMDEAEEVQYRAQLERELAAEDALFVRPGRTEAQ